MNVARWTLGLALLAMGPAVADAQTSIQTAFNYLDSNGNGNGCACAEPTCGCEPNCGCDNGCGDCCGSDCCGCNSGWGNCLGPCCLGDPCTLKDYLTPCCDKYNYGGWISLGYHSDTTRFSTFPGEGFSFNDVPHRLNLHQAWFYAERTAEGDACSADWGFRFDIVYGTDAQKMQAFGNSLNANGDPEHWDNPWDHGVYGWAIPQLYGEVAWGDWSVIAGHFFTLHGYEVCPAPDNFFYSHAFTMFNSEPFTHTGVLATYSGYENVELYAGWTLGWDTGFDQFDSGSNFHGGFSTDLTDDVNYTYIANAGDFGWRGVGYAHSHVIDFTLNECMNYVLQSDYVNVRNVEGVVGDDNEDVGINQYLFYTLNDCWKLGTRIEWWKSDAFTPNHQSYWGVTYGLNYKPHANVVIRPEVRHNWTGGRLAYEAENGVDFNQTVFGVDAIFTF